MALTGGEDQLVAALLTRLPPIPRARGVHAGAGQDDCAVVKSGKRTHWQLLKTDCVIEGVHFLPETPPAQVGWKAMCRPLSDIAATGGKPQYALVTLGLNRQRSPDWAAEVYGGIGRAADEFKVAVVGGETASTDGPSFLSVCLTGSVRKDRCVTRAGGRDGDLIYVTGALGGSFPSRKHLHFRPRIKEARWLSKHFSVHAMMDLSDGLAADLPRLARTSGTGYRIEPSSVPRTEGCTIAQALGDGEDYELLFTLAARHAAKLETAWKQRFPGLPLTQVGTLCEPEVVSGLGEAEGYDHFKFEVSRVAESNEPAEL